MTALEKTQQLERSTVSVDLIDLNPENPNVMNGREFDLLCDNIERIGMTEPVLLRPLENGRYRVVGGHQRMAAAKLKGFKEVPATVIRDSKFTDEAEQFQLIRMNVIHGHIDAQKFVNLYYRYAGSYPKDVLQELFGFADQKEFERLLKATQESLPKDMQKSFAKAATEVKTIDELARLLNRLFATYGDTLPYNFMLIDYGKQHSLWVRANPKQWDRAKTLSEWCVLHKRRLDEVLHLMIGDVLSNPSMLEYFKSITEEVPVDGGEAVQSTS